LRVSRDDVARALTAASPLVVREQAPNLKKLELVVKAYAPPATETVAMSARDGTKEASFAKAGEVIEMHASGDVHGQFTSHCPGDKK